MTIHRFARDPFARSCTIRRRTTPGVCTWCGKDGHRYQYGTETDAGRQTWHPHAFCTLACCHAYIR